MFFKTSYKWLLPVVGFSEATSVRLNVNRLNCDWGNALLHPIIFQIAQKTSLFLGMLCQCSLAFRLTKFEIF